MIINQLNPDWHITTADPDAEALARFEQVVLNQPQTVAEWQPVTDYSIEERRRIEGRHPDLILNTFMPQTVLDYGAGFGWLAQFLRIEANPKWRIVVDAYDPAPKGPGVKNYVPRASYDLVICREVLEHLPVFQIPSLIASICRYSRHYVYLTARLGPTGDHLLDIAQSDSLDPTHISLLQPTLIGLFFVLEGFKRQPHLEQQMDWQHQGRCFVYERHAVADTRG